MAANIHYRLLDSRRWQLSGSNLITDGLANLAGYYILLSPQVVNTLGGTPGSTIAASTIQGSALKQTTLDPAQPASDFTAANWLSKSWPDPANLTNFIKEIWVI